jgi:hypothetical protein
MKDPANEVRGPIPTPLQARCPATGRHIALPMAADWDELMGQKAIVTTPVCPACGSEHAWRLDEVFAAA